MGCGLLEEGSILSCWPGHTGNRVDDPKNLVLDSASQEPILHDCLTTVEYGEPSELGGLLERNGTPKIKANETMKYM